MPAGDTGLPCLDEGNMASSEALGEEGLSQAKSVVSIDRTDDDLSDMPQKFEAKRAEVLKLAVQVTITLDGS